MNATRLVVYLAGGYGVLAVGNLLIARATTNTPAGVNKWVDLNRKLLALNVLARMFPPPQPVIAGNATVAPSQSGDGTMQLTDGSLAAGSYA